ncbi:hypothetical protein LCGC14_1926040 [marine sediment metagenome]|uniref:Uncharacterized protein n=1 Tax=marine sediment metagenome TaxID=412755 RepID=A0A0F9FPA9_9ZZZZ
MFSLFRKYKGNPGPQGTEPPPLEVDDPFVGMHASLWRFLLHLDKRQALTDERVLFIMRWMAPAMLGLQLLILAYLLGA